MIRQHFLRGFAPARETAAPDTVPDCSSCRNSELHCSTPTACGLVEDELHPPKPRPLWDLFWDTAIESRAIAAALALGFCVGVGVAAWR